MQYSTKEEANAARKALQAKLGKATVTLTVEVPAEIAYRVGRAEGPWTVASFRPAELGKTVARDAVKRGLTIYAQAADRPEDPAKAAKSAERVEKKLATMTPEQQLQMLATAMHTTPEMLAAFMAKAKAKAK